MQTRKRKLQDWQLDSLNWKVTDSPTQAWFYSNKKRCKSEWKEDCIVKITTSQLNELVHFPSTKDKVKLRVHKKTTTVINPIQLKQLLQAIKKVFDIRDDPDHIYFEGISLIKDEFAVLFGS